MPGNTTLVTSPGPGVPLANCSVSFEESRVFLVVVYSVVCAVGLPTNCLTAWLTLQQALQGHVLAVYLFCLALCELLYSSTLPLWVIYIQNQHRWTLGPWACKVTAYIFFCNLYVSILLLCCVSCDRFMAVVYTLESRGRRHQKTAVLVSACVFVLVALVHYPVFNMPDRDTCYETLPMDGRTAGYYYARFTVGFAVPLSIIAFTNQRILRSIRLSSGLGAAQKARVKRSAVAVVAIFLVCFAPYHLALLASAVAFSYYRGDADSVCAFQARLHTVSAVFLCLSTVNSVADPIIYVLATEHSRQKVSRIHQQWRSWPARTEGPKLTCLKDAEEAPVPMLLPNGYRLPSKCSWITSWGLCASALERPNRVPSSSNWPPWDSLRPAKEQEPSPKGAVPTRSEAAGCHGPLGEPWGRALAPLASSRATRVSTVGGPGCPQPLCPLAGNAGGHPRKGDTPAIKAQRMAGRPSLSGEKLAGGSGQQIRVQQVTTPRPLRMEHGTESDARPWESRLPGNRPA